MKNFKNNKDAKYFEKQYSKPNKINNNLKYNNKKNNENHTKNQKFSKQNKRKNKKSNKLNLFNKITLGFKRLFNYLLLNLRKISIYLFKSLINVKFILFVISFSLLYFSNEDFKNWTNKAISDVSNFVKTKSIDLYNKTKDFYEYIITNSKALLSFLLSAYVINLLIPLLKYLSNNKNIIEIPSYKTNNSPKTSSYKPNNPNNNYNNNNNNNNNNITIKGKDKIIRKEFKNDNLKDINNAILNEVKIDNTTYKFYSKKDNIEEINMIKQLVKDIEKLKKENNEFINMFDKIIDKSLIEIEASKDKYVNEKDWEKDLATKIEDNLNNFVNENKDDNKKIKNIKKALLFYAIEMLKILKSYQDNIDKYNEYIIKLKKINSDLNNENTILKDKIIIKKDIKEKKTGIVNKPIKISAGLVGGGIIAQGFIKIGQALGFIGTRTAIN